MSHDREPSLFESAYLQALADIERPKPERPKLQKKTNTSPNLRYSTIVDFRRQNSEVVADQLADWIKAPEGKVLRKPTVHLEPAAVRAEEEQKRALTGKLRKQAQRMGGDWSDWMKAKESRADGWRHLDTKLSNSWKDLIVGMGELETESRIEVVESFAGGMGIKLDELDIMTDHRRYDNNRDRVDYVVKITSWQLKMDEEEVYEKFLISGRIRAPRYTVSSGALLCISFEHLSGYLGKPQISDEWGGFVKRRIEEDNVKAPFTASVGSKLIGEWIGQDSVREYFERRKV